MRIPLQIVEDRVVLLAVVECSALRVRMQLIEFVVDTGSPSSYLSDRDVRKLQIPIKDRPTAAEVDFGGSRFKQISLPKFIMHLLPEDKADPPLQRAVSLTALKTTKLSQKKITAAQTLPSILGIDFLRAQQFSLHLLPKEALAYLQSEE